MVLHFEVSGDESGDTILLLHGITGSERYWQPLLDCPVTAKRYIAIDLLGFGRSPVPTNIIYDYETHIQSIKDTLDAANITGPITIVGHSMGALLGLRLAAEQPALVSKLILCGLPVYPDAVTARREITQSKWYVQRAYYGLTSRILCTLWCTKLRPISRRLAHLYLRQVPPNVASDSVLHSWQSYAQSLHYVIERQQVAIDLQRVTAKVQLVYGAHDGSSKYLAKMGIPLIDKLQILTYPGLGHQLPVDKPTIIADLL